MPHAALFNAGGFWIFFLPAKTEVLDIQILFSNKTAGFDKDKVIKRVETHHKRKARGNLFKGFMCTASSKKNNKNDQQNNPRLKLSRFSAFPTFRLNNYLRHT